MIRLATSFEVSALLRRVQGEGGFATVLHRGEAESGALLVVATGPGEGRRAWERMPSLDGGNAWHCARRTDSPDSPGHADDFGDWIARRSQQDPDLWIIELDIPQAERFIGATASEG